MGRRSGGGRSGFRPRAAPVRNPPQPAARSPPPAPAQSRVGDMPGGLGANFVDGISFGGGNAMAHRAVDPIMGPRTIQHVTVGNEGAAAPAANMNSAGGSNACGNQNKAFQDCLNHYGSDIGKCQFYLDMLSECRRSSGSSR
ncbi:hypothetical protein MKW94_021632 [Papaver nudicaule]|uniref:CHCH domain-containing protein n=1 Tax=Papaver nudicaule TaxID=74823 RepID=A0AA41RY11_PAPNU|nr:hypothetical protein [Papaver nudicaule]